MSASSYQVDSDGDLLIILTIPREPFALWEIVEAPAIENPSVFDGPTDERTSDGGEHPSGQLQLKVSSKHMMMASPRFQKMLSGNWVEAKTIHPDGYRHVELEGFDPESTKIVLNILHGKTRRVPRTVDLELLAKIAVVVDDLECYEEVEVFSDMWIASSTATVPIEYDRNLILWILISFVFRKPELFRSTTQTAILRSPGPFQTLALPIRQSVVEEINRQREDLVEGIITALYSLLDHLRTSKMCIFECQSILLGALIKHMSPLNLLEPRPLKPFSGFSFAQIAQTARHFRNPIWYSDPLQTLLEEPKYEEGEPKYEEGLEKPGSASRKKKMSKARGGERVEEYKESEYLKREEYQKHKCNLQSYLQPEVDRLHESVHGLELGEE